MSWLALLSEYCARHSQADAARRLGVSPAMINQALKGVYKGDLQRLEKRVLGELGSQTVACPVAGTLTLRQCDDYRRAGLRSGNALRHAFFRACPECPHNPEGNP